MPVPRASIEAIGRQFVDAFNRRVRSTDGGFLVISEVLLGGELVSPSAMLARLGEDGLIVEARAFLTDAETLRQVGWAPDRAS